MRVRIGLTATVEPNGRIEVKAEIGWVELGMLAGKDQRRCKPALAERVSDRCKLDGFGTSPDDQNNATGQPSP